MKNRIVQAIVAVLATANLSAVAFPAQSVYQSTKNGVTVTAVDYAFKVDEAVLTMPQALWGFLPCRSIKATQLLSLGIRPVEITVSADSKFKDVIIRAENIQYPQVTVVDVQERVSKALAGSVWRKAANYFGIWYGMTSVARVLMVPTAEKRLYIDLILGCTHMDTPEKNAAGTRDLRWFYVKQQAARLALSSIVAYVAHKTEQKAIKQAVTGATITARCVSGGHGQQSFYLYLDNSLADKKITMTVQDFHTNETVADFEFVLN